MAHDQAYYQAEKKIEKVRRLKATQLALIDMRLTEIPESVGNLSQLQVLDLSRNELETLPKSLNKLTRLKRLSLRENLFTTLPESLGQLRELQLLDIGRNQLLEIPTSVQQLTQLRSLNASHNELMSLPEFLGEFESLQSLYLSNNQLKELPESLFNSKYIKELDLSGNLLTTLPEQIGRLTELLSLLVSGNKLTELPKSLCQLINLKNIYLGAIGKGGNPLGVFPLAIRSLPNLEKIWANECKIVSIPEWLCELPALKDLDLESNYISELPISLNKLEKLERLNIDNNPLNPELAKAYEQGFYSVISYIRAKGKERIVLNESKLILIGEGEVGKSCLLDALLDKPFQTHESTHGIEIQSFNVTTDSQTSITLNAWDFGGQRVYRPTHQLFFSAPAVYLVVWKPREGSQAGQVKVWIQLVKRREPSAKILVVATHGGPQQRQPDIDRQELWDLFGRETVVDFFFVDSKPDAQGNRKGIDELKRAIAQVAASLPEVGRSVPKSFADVRQALQATGKAYLPLRDVLDICRAHNMDDEIARLFITISHRLGHLTHYENDPTLRDIVILRPDWLATAMSYVFDDEETRAKHGLVNFSRLSQIWDDSNRPADTRYPDSLHRIFLKLMGRFDLSYPVPALSPTGDSDPQSLIAQFVPDNRPQNYFTAWLEAPSSGDIQQTQICRIADDKGNTAEAEGLFYQLIVRLHKYSLGRVVYADSVHWQRGLVLDDDYNGRALLEHKGNDVHITVRAPYPERFLAMLTEEVRYLVESFWEGLRCDVTVPCLVTPECKGLFEVSKLMENMKRDRKEQPCPICNEWQSIGQLLSNAPDAAQPISMDILIKEFAEVKNSLKKVSTSVTEVKTEVNAGTQRILSQIDQKYNDLLKILQDEAKEGPRLFSLIPVKRSGFNPKRWASEKFRLILWCEHTRLPLPLLNGKDSQKGIYEIQLTREWFKKSAPLLKLMTNALSLALPLAAVGAKLVIDKAVYDSLEDQFTFGKEMIDLTLSASDKAGLWTDAGEYVDLPDGIAVIAENATLRELRSFLKEKDPGFGGLVRVMNKRQEFLWAHEKFAGEY